MSKTEMHEATDQCLDFHCYIHAVDEPGPGYLACGECFHLFKRARDLRRAVYQDRRKMGLRWRFVRASRVTFCPFCAHDF